MKDSILKSGAIVASLADIGFAGETLKEKNDWKLRMIKASMGKGYILNENWDEVPEEEKERRLDAVIKIMKDV